MDEGNYPFSGESGIPSKTPIKLEILTEWEFRVQEQTKRNLKVILPENGSPHILGGFMLLKAKIWLS